MTALQVPEILGATLRGSDAQDVEVLPHRNLEAKAFGWWTPHPRDTYPLPQPLDRNGLSLNHIWLRSGCAETEGLWAAAWAPSARLVGMWAMT